MLERQSRLKHDSMSEGQEDAIIKDEKLSDAEKKETLQNSLNLAASNGDTPTVERFVSGNAKNFIDVNAPDSDGTPPLIYAACFGHEEVVAALLDAGADVDTQDRNRWTPLMWAITNRHKAIAKLLLDKGAKPETESSSGRTAFDFVAPGSELQDYLHESGYTIGTIGVTSGDDFYTAGFEQDRFEEEMAENELRRRMMMESAINLEVDLGNLGIDEQPEVCESFCVRNERLLTRLGARGIRGGPGIRVGPVSERPNVCFPGERAGSHPGHSDHQHDAYPVTFAETSTREHYFPKCTLCPLPC